MKLIKLPKSLMNRLVCVECKLYHTGEATKNKCFQKHKLNTSIRGDLILDWINNIGNQIDELKVCVDDRPHETKKGEVVHFKDCEWEIPNPQSVHDLLRR